MSDDSDYLILAVGIIAFLLCGASTKTYVDTNRESANLIIEAKKQEKALAKQQAQQYYQKKFCESWHMQYARTTERLKQEIAENYKVDQMGWVTAEDIAGWKQLPIDQLNYHLAHPPTC